jgi:hypothetical protein
MTMPNVGWRRFSDIAVRDPVGSGGIGASFHKHTLI